jgi:Leucine-rich repeat (LRR) protein
MQERNYEFQNLLRLLESSEPTNVQLGLQLAQNYEAEFEQYFGCRLDYESYAELISFLRKNISKEEYKALSKYSSTINSYSEYLKDNITVADLMDLKTLKNLRIKGEKLKNIPKLRFLLFGLKGITLKQTDLKHIPLELYYLKNLEFLDLTDNKIRIIPPFIENLQNLKTLYLYDNKIRFISPKICNLQGLVYLALGNNKLVHLPSEIEKLQNIEVLDIGNNLLTHLPESISNMRKLKALWIHNNNLTELPLSFKSMVNCKIYVGKNPNDALYKCIEGWENVVFEDN